MNKTTHAQTFQVDFSSNNQCDTGASQHMAILLLQVLLLLLGSHNYMEYCFESFYNIKSLKCVICEIPVVVITEK